MSRYITASTSSQNPGASDTKSIFGTGQYRIFNSSCAWTVPAGASKVRVTILGAGGGAGGHWAAIDGNSSCYSCNWDCSCCCIVAPYYNAGNYMGYGATCLNTMNYTGMFSIGGSGGGGGYVVGAQTVTPGCVCCIVVGGGGATGCSKAYWCLSDTLYKCFVCLPLSTNSLSCCCNSGSLCGDTGSAGGYSCAFGFCAGGGGGGQGGICGYCSLERCLWTANTASFATAGSAWCVCLAAQTVSGGAGGSASGGNIANYAGSAGLGGGSTIVNLSCFDSNTMSNPKCCSCRNVCSCSAYGQYYGSYVITQPQCSFWPANPVYAGNAGSPMGVSCCGRLPQIFNGLGFNGLCCSDSQLISTYDLPYPRWPGQIVYSQIPGTIGARGSCVSTGVGSVNCTVTCNYCCCCICPVAGTCYVQCCYNSSCYDNYTLCTLSLWNGANTADYSSSVGQSLQCSYFFCYQCAPLYCCFQWTMCSTSNITYNPPGCGGGAVPSPVMFNPQLAAYRYPLCMSGGNGQVIVEW